MNSELFDKQSFLNSLSETQMDTFNKLNLAQKEQGNMEPLERQAFYDEQDDYWLVMEMY